MTITETKTLDVELQHSTLYTYIVIAKGNPQIIVNKFWQKYEDARKTAISVGGVVTNPSWLRYMGLKVVLWEKKMKEPKLVKVFASNVTKPSVVEILTIDGISIPKGN